MIILTLIKGYYSKVLQSLLKLITVDKTDWLGSLTSLERGEQSCFVLCGTHNERAHCFLTCEPKCFCLSKDFKKSLGNCLQFDTTSIFTTSIFTNISIKNSFVFKLSKLTYYFAEIFGLPSRQISKLPCI